MWDYFVQITHPGTILLAGDTASGRTYVSELMHGRDGSSYLNYMPTSQKPIQLGSTRTSPTTTDGQRVPVTAEVTAGARCTLIVGKETVDCRKIG